MAPGAGHDALRQWLERFGRAWETRDPELVAELFTDDASYWDDPFGEPLRGIGELRAYWTDLPKPRGDIRFASEVLAVSENRGMGHWHGSYTREEDGAEVELDGILLLALDDEGRCQAFREWTSRRE